MLAPIWMQGEIPRRRLAQIALTVFAVLAVTFVLLHYIRSGTSPPKPLSVRRSCSASVAPYKQSAIKWRRIAGMATCRTDSPVSVTGSWCLPVDPASGPGRQAKHLLPADAGVGAGIAKHLGGENYSLIEIGAGVGQYGYYLRARNASLRWFGYDGAENVEEFTGGFVAWTEVTDETLDAIPFRGDWVMSLEVGENVPPNRTEEFIKTLDRHNEKGVVLSWAIPGQEGLRHANAMSNEEVVEIMAKHGYVQNEWCRAFQKEVRENAQYVWFRETVMVFVREHPLQEPVRNDLWSASHSA